MIAKGETFYCQFDVDDNPLGLTPGRTMGVKNVVEFCRHLTAVAKVPHRFSLTDSKGYLAIHNEEAEECLFTPVYFPRKPELEDYEVAEWDTFPIWLDKFLRLASMATEDKVRPLLQYIWVDELIWAGNETHLGYIADDHDLPHCGIPTEGLGWESAAFPKELIPYVMLGDNLILKPYEDELRVLKTKPGPHPFPKTQDWTAGTVAALKGKEFARLFKGSVKAERPLVTLETANGELNLTFQTYMQATTEVDLEFTEDFKAHYWGESLYQMAKRSSKDPLLTLGDNKGILIKVETELAPAEMIWPCVME